MLPTAELSRTTPEAQGIASAAILHVPILSQELPSARNVNA
jgi:hypothetical protein